MNAIIGLSGLLRRRALPEDVADKLVKIETAGKHLLTIIDDILDISKIEAGRLMLSERLLDVPALADQAVALLGEAARAKGLALSIESGPLPARLLGDATRLTQALLNLVGNAVKFTERGSVTVRIACDDEDDRSARIRFEVVDTGVGIPADAMARLFSPFEQADASRLQGAAGTGLGLAITRRLAQLMGGDAGARSVPGEGSCFWFTARLRRDGDEARGVDAPASADVVETLRGHVGDRRILLVEDNAINRMVAQEILAAAGLACDAAGDGAEAVEIVRRSAPDDYCVVLMDMRMPTLDGVAATRAIRTLPSGRTLPIVAMTANAFSEDEAQCLAAGMNDFVSKPVDPDRLYAVLLKWVVPR